MYYSFYMNERMLLDEWNYYQKKGECNWLLKRTLMNDNTRTPEEKIQFYFDNRRVRWEYSEFFKEQARNVREYIDELDGCFESDSEMEYFLDNRYINDDYEIMDYGHNQRLFNMYRRYNELEDKANDLVIQQLNYKPKSNYKLREHEIISINRADIKFIRNARKYNDLTVPQIEILFGIIFFCRMNDTPTANLNTEFKQKQFIGCFNAATMKDFEYVTSHIYGIEKTEDNDILYSGFDSWMHYDEHGEITNTDDWIHINVTKCNNKLNLTKMAHKYITDISDKRYCEMCLKPFEPTNNRQKVCPECKAKADAIKARMRKVKQRYIQKNGKDACCGDCLNCIKTDCSNWFEYWFDELDTREIDYRNKMKYASTKDIPEDKKQEILEQLFYDIQNVYTKEEKSEIIPWEKMVKSKRYC